MVQQIALPIKDSNILKMVQDTLLDSFRSGRRNYTIFQVGKATLLRVSDVMKLKKSDVFNPDGTVTVKGSDGKMKVLPKTGETENIALSVLGSLMVLGSAFIFKKRI